MSYLEQLLLGQVLERAAAAGRRQREAPARRRQPRVDVLRHQIIHRHLRTNNRGNKCTGEINAPGK